MPVTVATFYKFAALTDYADLQQPLRDICQRQNIKGTILLAAEGINGTIAGTKAGLDTVLAHIQADPRLASLDIKESPAAETPFEKLKVRLKKEIVTIGLPEVSPTQQVGTYVPPRAWNEIIADPEVTVIDTRNDYEVGMGTFQGAKNPQTEVFNEFPSYVKENLNPKKNKKVAMFCTGGIRCEKASSYMLAQGFEEVYHLQGGILKYLEEVPEEESLWNGECFVFDERVAIKHGLEPGTYAMCYACGHPISEEDQQSVDYESEVSCPHCVGELTEEKRDRLRERKRQRHLNAKKNNTGPR
ncbi:rhodanese-related sulfurtransferase [cf. Phormidesmis sp. LEGE 11477]|nr:rhodanese-related sulfurtransferase [cf. Phormidesmis sp. LEGE 11477]